jgi:hypothetical protein
MNPKDEIQKLIQSELEKWENYDIKNENFRVGQTARFQPLRSLLNELLASIEPEYIKSNVLEDRAEIEVGHENNGTSKIHWTIQPNFKTQERQEEYWSLNLWQHKVNLEEAPGFTVNEKQGEDRERTLEFNTAQEVILCLAQEIAKRVAFYRYTKKHS